MKFKKYYFKREDKSVGRCDYEIVRGDEVCACNKSANYIQVVKENMSFNINENFKLKRKGICLCNKHIKYVNGVNVIK